MVEQLLHPKNFARASSRPPVTGTGGFSRMRLTRLRDTLERHMESDRIPGLVALVYQRGREHVETLGTMGFDSTEPVRRDTLFRLASTTKPITAAAAMILVEECRIRLDDPIDTWLPELANRRVLKAIDGPIEDTVPAQRPITVRDLLTFRSGYGELALAGPMSPLHQALMKSGVTLAEWPFTGTPDEFIKRLGDLPLAHQPGERWLYHTSADILGVLIARATGKSLGRFLREHILEPLGMRDTFFQVPPGKLDRLPACYGTDPATGEFIMLDEAGGGYAARPLALESGAGGLVSTVDDLLAFGRMMMVNGGGERILSRPTIELMTTDHLTPGQKAVSPFFENFWSSRGWGLGMGVITTRSDLGEVPGRFGWDGAFGTSWYVDPRQALVGVLMTQRRPDRLSLPPVILDFWTSVYQLIEE